MAEIVVQPQEQRTTTADEFYAELTASAEKFIPEEVQERLRDARIIVAGCGSIGNPIAMMAVRQGAENVSVLDPDKVEVGNLSRQEYEFHQEGKNKAQMTALNMRLVNPHASKKIRSYPEGLTIENAEGLIREADIVIDAVDIRALDVIYELHRQASIHRKPVIVGYDLAGTAMLAIYRYDIEDLEPLGGELGEEKIKEFKTVRAEFEAGRITEGAFLDYIYDAFTGPINPLKVPVEQLREILERGPDDTRTYQVGTTSRTLSALAVEAMRRILGGEDVKSVVVVDVPSQVRRKNPRIWSKLGLLARVLPVINARGKSVQGTLHKIKSEEAL
ncbi:ThiF family adenylyltransferase [Candidatus Dojkabacteria bacterium]|nr:ThiF family adenylyltransferase [Candidatus Dojkabacteria bacterium]